MRLKTLVLCSSSVAMLTFAAPAWAQGTPQTGPVDTDPVRTESIPNDPDAAAPQQEGSVEGEGEEIVVTGLRRSLQSAQSLKRNSDQIVDAIVAEDIGKLPDITASAALARLPGIQVGRIAGEAADVRVRGLPDVSTTYNGREIFTRNDRNVAIQDFPAGTVAALEVYKAGSANLIEGGIGGQVNVRSRRPFDFKELEISGQLNLVKFEQSKDVEWNGNLLVSNRWDIGDGGEIGLLVNGALTNIDFLDSTREQARFIEEGIEVAGSPGTFRRADGDRGERGRATNIRFPDASGLFYGRGDRYRPSLNAALQYKPNDDLQFYLDALWQGYRGRDSNYFQLVPAFGDGRFTNVRLREGSTTLVDSLTSMGSATSNGRNEFLDSRTDTFQFGGGATYDLGAVRLSGDVAYTDSTFKEDQINLDYEFRRSPVTNFVFNSDRGEGGASFDYIDFDATDPANYQVIGFFERKLEQKGKDLQARADLEYDTGFTNLPKLQFGVRYNDRDASSRRGDYFTNTRGRNIGYEAFGIPVIQRERGFAYDNYQPETGFVGVNFDDLYGDIERIRTFVGTPTTDPGFDPAQIFDANEKTSAAYAQLRYEFDAGFPIDGLIGLRAVRTKIDVTGFTRDPATNTFSPVTAGKSFTDFLPNASARFEFKPGLQLRLAYTQTRTRANFGDFNPGTNFDNPPNDQFCSVPANRTNPENAERCATNARGGNPSLEPLNSTNYDATLEYYFSRTGSLTFAAFRRDVRGFIFSETRVVADPTFSFVRLTTPFNAGAGRIQGIEAGFTSFLDFESLPDFAKGFGIQANYTYLDASTSLGQNFRTVLPGQQDFPNISKHAYNVVGIYERYKFSARLAYNYRSQFVIEYIGDNGFPSPIRQAGLGTLDFSTSYTPFENLTIAFDALNLLAGSQPVKTYRAINTEGDSYRFQTRYLERVYSLGIRFRY